MNKEERKNIIDNKIILLDMEEVMQITGWCENVVKDTFSHDAEFPAIKKGKKNQVELDALKKYLSVKRVNIHWI